jgi:hypothetical protein
LRSEDPTAAAVSIGVATRATPIDVAQLPSLTAASSAFAIAGDAVTIDRGLLDVVALMAGAVDEQRGAPLDRHGRVPAEATIAVRNGVERDPVVQHAAIALRDAVVQAAGERRVVLLAPWPEGKRWAMAMTHDLDVVSGWPVFTALRTIELLGKGELGRVGRVLAGAVASVAGDPVIAAARAVMDVERNRGVRSTWFIITETPSVSSARAGDVTYTPESPRARRIIAEVGAAGHELGLHGSFATYVTSATFAAQRERLTAIVGRDVPGVRQHFLRMQPGVSHRAMLDAAFSYDSTFGFADRNGFRLGAADVLPVWHEGEQRALPLDELPFVWMDRALSKYRGVENPQRWIEDALAIAGRCREVEGAWCGIWHPNLSTPLGFPGAEQAFGSLVQGLMAGDPWAASAGDIVQWRRARRAVRAVAGDATAGVRIRFSPHGAAPVLEDHMGRRVPAVPA